MIVDRNALRDLSVLISAARTPREAQLLLEDLFTPRERVFFSERWRLVQLLAAGMKQRDIKKTMNISISKITRGSRMFKHGSGGFTLFLRRLKNLPRKR